MKVLNYRSKKKYFELFTEYYRPVAINNYQIKLGRKDAILQSNANGKHHIPSKSLSRNCKQVNMVKKKVYGNHQACYLRYKFLILRQLLPRYIYI